MDKGEEIVKKRGLTVLTATIFLVGEMAGAGALKLPNAMIGTGMCKTSTFYSPFVVTFSD